MNELEKFVFPLDIIITVKESMRSLFLLSFVVITSSAQATTTPVFVQRTNVNFPGGGIITTAASLQGTLVTDTRLTPSTTQPPISVTTTQASTRIATTASTTVTTPQTRTVALETTAEITTTVQSRVSTTVKIDTTIPYTTLVGSTVGTPSTGYAKTTSTQLPNTLDLATTTFHATRYVPNTLYSTVISTTTIQVATSLRATVTAFETVAVGKGTSTSHRTSLSTSTLTIPGTTATSHGHTTITEWLRTTVASTVTVHITTYSTFLASRSTKLATVFSSVKSETTTTWYEPSFCTNWNGTITTWIPKESTSVWYETVEYVETELLYNCLTSTSVQLATLTLSADVWKPTLVTISSDDTSIAEPITQTITPVYQFIEKSPYTVYSTVTKLIPKTTVTTTLTRTLTSYVTSYLLNDEQIYPFTTVTYTFSQPVTTVIQTSIISTSTRTTVSFIMVSVTEKLSATALTRTIEATVTTTASTTVSEECAQLAQVFTANGAFPFQKNVENALYSIWLAMVLLV